MAEASRRMMRFVWQSHKLIWTLSRGRLGRKLGSMPVLELLTTVGREVARRQGGRVEQSRLPEDVERRGGRRPRICGLPETLTRPIPIVGLRPR